MTCQRACSASVRVQGRHHGAVVVPSRRMSDLRPSRPEKLVLERAHAPVEVDGTEACPRTREASWASSGIPTAARPAGATGGDHALTHGVSRDDDVFGAPELWSLKAETPEECETHTLCRPSRRPRVGKPRDGVLLVEPRGTPARMTGADKRELDVGHPKPTATSGRPDSPKWARIAEAGAPFAHERRDERPRARAIEPRHDDREEVESPPGERASPSSLVVCPRERHVVPAGTELLREGKRGLM